MEPILNRVAESEIETFDLEELWDGRDIAQFDLADYLIEGLVLREKPFREAMKTHDWSAYDGKHVAIHCSTDAIIPTWAAMLVAVKLKDQAESVAFGSRKDLIRDYYVRRLENVDWQAYKDKPVVIKGCASDVVPADAYLIATRKLQGVARKLMYGEACSAVPLWRKKAEKEPDNSGKPAGIKVAGLPKGPTAGA
ncbi:MAG: DUF2480 family protein [Rubricoccaceae bacterium]|nr:DUF2480 family protein [Rubricoccaceae bacterium]